MSTASTRAMPGSVEWRTAEAVRLLDFARASICDVGFVWLDDAGVPEPTEDRELWINARMTYVFADAHRRGVEGVPGAARHGIDALLDAFRDPVHDGWYRVVDLHGPVDDAKSCYEHAFVVLAGCAAQDAGIERGAELLAAALKVHEERFFDAASGRCREEWSRDWQVLDPYRGANSNMHSVEAYLAAARSTGDSVWLTRAASIADGIMQSARTHDWRVVEHFDASWRPRPDFNRERPRDRFRPFGATPGHGFEWARLLLQLDDALDGTWDGTLPGTAGRPTGGLGAMARSLFDRAAADTRDGLVYTTDWDGHPVVTERFHWVLCEALLAADALAATAPVASPEPTYARLRERWWRLAERHFVDRDRGSWHHELDAELSPSSGTWSGKPDVYHAYNACVLTHPAPSFS